MTSAQINTFLKALETVKQDYMCGVCLELCKKPVTLKSCFHIICEEHLNTVVKCPTCDIPLLDKSVFIEDRLEESIHSFRELDKIFIPFKKDISSQQSSKVDSVTTVSKKRNIKKQANIDTKKSSRTATTTTENLVKSKDPNYSFQSASNSLKVNKTVEKRNNKGETSLHVACRLGKVDKVRELLSEGANPNSKDNAGWTPLHEVVQNGRLDLVKLLLQYNTLINVPGPGNETPLHEAVRYNHKDVVNELVIHGADLDSRNCKGETPVQLASDKMKKILKAAAEHILQTQTVNVTHISLVQMELDFDDIRIYCITKFRTNHIKLKLLMKHHSNLHLETKFTKKVTHLIVDTDEDEVCIPSLDVLQGIVYGVWILSSNWIIKSTENKLESFNDYEVKGVGTTKFMGHKNSRINKYKQLPGIFNGCHFYLHNLTSDYEISKTIILNKAVLTKLITDGGGVVLRRVPNPESIPETEKLVPYHAKKGGKLEICSHYIIFKDLYEPMYNMKHLKALPIAWVIECIENYELCDPE